MHSSPGQSLALGADHSVFCVQTSAHAGMGTGIFSAIILITGAVALAAYSYFRLNRRAIGFQRFEVKEKSGSGGGGAPSAFCCCNRMPESAEVWRTEVLCGSWFWSPHGPEQFLARTSSHLTSAVCRAPLYGTLLPW